MTTRSCPKKRSGKHRKHTPIVSEKQRGLFGAEYARRKAGKKGRMPGITKKELRSHLKEAKGKKLPAKSRRRRK
jgi:hypothetical protein